MSLAYDPAAERAMTFIESMCTEPLLHGDPQHRQWLIDELHKYIEPLRTLLDEEYGEGYDDAKALYTTHEV